MMKTSSQRKFRIRLILGPNGRIAVYRLRIAIYHNQDNILDLSSGLLHLAGNSLIPESINKSCLENAKVLQ